MEFTSPEKFKTAIKMLKLIYVSWKTGNFKTNYLYKAFLSQLGNFQYGVAIVWWW